MRSSKSSLQIFKTLFAPTCDTVYFSPAITYSLIKFAKCFHFCVLFNCITVRLPWQQIGDGKYDIFQRKPTQTKNEWKEVIWNCYLKIYGETYHILIRGIQFTITVCLFVSFFRLKKPSSSIQLLQVWGLILDQTS